MAFLVFLIIFSVVFITLKLLGIIIKAGFLMLSIPLLILISFITAFIAVILLPVAVAGPFSAVVQMPHAINLLIPIALIVIGLFLFRR